MDPYIIKSHNGKRKREHQVVAEIALGKPLPNGAEVHHVDLNKRNNANSNLVICPSPEYHDLLHIRTAALEAAGNAHWLKCRFCKQWDDPQNLFVTLRKDRKNQTGYHRKCNAEYMKDLRAKLEKRNGAS